MFEPGRAQLVSEINDPLFETHVLGKVGMALLRFGDPAWRSPVDRVLAITGGSPRQRREVGAYWSLAVAACWAGQLEVAERLLRSGLDAAATKENTRLEIGLRSTEAVRAYCRGAWDGLADDVAILLDELSDSPTDGGLDMQLVAGCLALARGEVGEARRRSFEVLGAIDRLDDPQVLPAAAAAAARVALFCGDVEDAQASVRLGLTGLTAKGVWAPIARLLPTAAEVLVAAGRHDEVTDLVDRAERELRGLDAPLAPAAVRYSRGVLTSSAEHFLAAAEFYAAVHSLYEAAQAWERAAGCLIADGDTRSATSSLRSAMDAYERLGATWDLGRVAKLARQHGLKPPAAYRGGTRGYGAKLSPRERQVAALAAAGRTNKEIGTELFISKYTVEKHLTAVMRKLKAKSRLELAGRLDEAVS